ncbi:zinc finger protein 395b isoform X1 [Etheostoma spectabile]|uniref:zinc finger protein 395b isoform X1 n=1 Tax=Etheostoma spectabile TaxID=54343 RepID=UPI0013AF6426|nr:zinc finger protein 395-like isoform X1 [Etheostoma spectabile]
MAAMGPEDRVGAGPGGTAVCQVGPHACTATTTHSSNGPDMQQTLVCTQRRVQAGKTLVEGGHHENKTSVSPAQREAERGWKNLAAPLQTMGPTMHLSNASATREAPYSFRSPESVEMDEIMAAMVLTSLSCSPVVQSPPHTDPVPAGSSSSADMECGGGELSDSGSSGYWSWDHGNVSPAPSPSVTEMDGSPDEGLQMELDQGEELNAKKPKSSFRGVYKCLWPGCGKVLTSSVGMKRHIRVLHLCSGSDQSQREEDFYYTKISCETVDASSVPAPPGPLVPPAPSQQALGQASSSQLSWASCTSTVASGLQIPPDHRPRSNSSSGAGPSRPSPLSQSAPSSFWQIHSEHLYQACSPVQVSLAPKSPGCQGWTPSASVSGPSNTPVVKARCRSVSVGEQWLQQNRLQPMSVSPSRTHCSFRKGRGEAKKCRKVYGVERKDQWCTACRWKKACQRFPD